MKITSILNESQINELGILKNLKGAVRGAVSGYQAGKLKRKGKTHSARIVNNLRSEFHRLVGGGTEPTYQNLINFLSGHGLSELETIPDPTNTRSTTRNPTVEAVGNQLSAVQIDNIIRAAVRKNYSRIVAAQQGRQLNPAPAAGGSPAPAPTTGGSPAPAPTTGGSPAPAPAPTRRVPANVEAIKRAYSILDPDERAQLKKELDMIDDHDRLASGTNEAVVSKITSKFLGIDL
jgi:hypothetical protein